eukprot:CAMPEP_0183801000 /NCGR_PEP_ID=MMETSP0803_2-20130417/26564_1 /TAXON_ID=195967 /ORGANISM="Crustomastix stigmata, Strain CCMP3273" /LENGTH=66 /DNA_ID=CAMNT_0026045717 /DNA_START=79 /DNA_END=275 /DNA_ORIENTATION=+
MERVARSFSAAAHAVSRATPAMGAHAPRTSSRSSATPAACSLPFFTAAAASLGAAGPAGSHDAVAG